jgi:hypothetical protein
MNRLLKFRARCVVTKKIQDELYNGQCFAWVNHENQNNIIIEQFTGLQDSKGVDIYFYDVVYIAGYGNLLISSLGDLVILVDALSENDIGEILGSINENENLIEASK